MAKLMTLVACAPGFSPEAFRAHWRSDFFPKFQSLAICTNGLSRAVHHHTLPTAVRAGEGFIAPSWAGVGCYYLDNHGDAERLVADAELRRIFEEAPYIERVTHLVVNEIWMYNRDKSDLPLKMFSFFKRHPRFTREFAQEYYLTIHADVGDSINKNRTVRYVQNHVLRTYKNEDAEYDFDAGPEIWFKSQEIADDLFADRDAMAVLSQDEERFCLRGQNIFMMTDEDVVYSAPIEAQ